MYHTRLRARQGLALAGGVLAAAPAAMAAGPLAAVGDAVMYVSPIRVVIILVCLVPWLAFCQWVDKDTNFVRRMNREMWNGIVLGGGVVGLAVWLFLPWRSPGLFAAGFGLWFVITVGTCGLYVLLRNNQVDPGSRVFTKRHIQHWWRTRSQKKEEHSMAIERVKLSGHDGKKLSAPEDPTQTEPYEAAQTLLFDSLWRRATDVEMLVGQNGMKLAYRIDGVVIPRPDLFERDKADLAIRYLKTAAGLEVDERRRPQSGRISGQIAGGTGGAAQIEVQSSGTTQLERMALKVIADQNRLRLGDIGLLQAQRDALDAVIKRPGGLVLVSGPKESGVTTTLYASLRQHDAFMQNLLTLEMSRLMELENITQYVYDSTKHESSYARQLQTVLRREPDVVMVSDCLDRETAHLAATAVRSGKRIYMGVQARDSFDALKRVISLAGDTDAVADSLQAVTSQRLMRKLCIACRIPYKPDAALLKKANLPADKIDQFYRTPRPEEMVDEKGHPRVCPNCQGSGYFGRTAIFEVFVVDDATRELIRRGEPVSTLRQAARKSGMLYLQEVGLQKVIDGTTSMNEMLRVVRDEEAKPAA